MKSAFSYMCASCAFESAKWLGRCPQCEAWNSFSEKMETAYMPTKKRIRTHARDPVDFGELASRAQNEERLTTGMKEFDRVLGGGIVVGAIMLLTGEPGIGKSTLTLQIADCLGAQGKSVLYFSGEETESQIALRGKRLGIPLKNLRLLSESTLETILATAEAKKPDFIIIDSIQVMHSQSIPGASGSVSQVRLCTEAILQFTKPKKIPVLLIGHVTKDGTLAGPRVLEHLVDAVLYLEGSRTHDLRLVRGVKNRFGSATETGVFEMTAAGLREVQNPGSFFLRPREHVPAGSALTMTLEGSRPILVEIQALTNATVFGYPVRKTSGFAANRLQLLLAVLQKQLGVGLGNQDVFVNVASGYRVNDPAADLAVCLAILSSFYKKPLPHNLVAIGEVGLTGEIRAPKEIEKRQKEAKKLGLVCQKIERALTAYIQQIFTLAGAVEQKPALADQLPNNSAR